MCAYTDAQLSRMASCRALECSSYTSPAGGVETGSTSRLLILRRFGVGSGAPHRFGVSLEIPFSTGRAMANATNERFGCAATRAFPQVIASSEGPAACCTFMHGGVPICLPNRHAVGTASSSKEMTRNEGAGLLKRQRCCALHARRTGPIGVES